MTEINFGLAMVGLLLSVIALLLAWFTYRDWREARQWLFQMKTTAEGRTHFNECAVHIYREAAARRVWAISDTFSTDETYYRFFTRAKPATLKRITFFGPLARHRPILVGALLRTVLAPQATVRHLDADVVRELRHRFPLKAVIGGTMALVGNRRIGSYAGSEYAVFIDTHPNPFAAFLREVYESLGLGDRMTLDEWVADTCRESGFDLATATPETLCDFLVEPDAVAEYFTRFGDHPWVSLGDLRSAIEQLLDRLTSAPEPETKEEG